MHRNEAGLQLNIGDVSLRLIVPPPISLRLLFVLQDIFLNLISTIPNHIRPKLTDVIIVKKIGTLSSITEHISKLKYLV